MTLSSLIERLEKAEGPSRELDILIGYAVDLEADEGHMSFRNNFDICGMKQMLRMAESYQNVWSTMLPRYTSSIDAALTLVPEGFKWKAGYSYLVPHNAEVRDYRDNPICGSFIGESDANRAIAICIAALKAYESLRARSAMTEGKNG